MIKPCTTPALLTEILGEQALLAAEYTIENSMALRSLFPIVEGRRDYHIVIIVPSMLEPALLDYEKSMARGLQPRILAEKSFGLIDDWAYPYKDICRSKAHQLWTGRHDGRTDFMPHLLFFGDTPYWGGVERDGIVVACSGFECHADRFISSFIADTLIALSYDEWLKSSEKKKGANFLPIQES